MVIAKLKIAFLPVNYPLEKWFRTVVCKRVFKYWLCYFAKYVW